MKIPLSPAFLVALAAGAAFAPAARAQMVPNGQNGPSVQPRAPTPDIAPPALPGAGDAAGIATAPKIAKANVGDPTTELFNAVNNDDYNSAQDAISRGADLTAQNALGETPLDLAIALNRNSLTFLILGARDEGGGPASGGAVASAPLAAPARTSTTTHARAHAVPAAAQTEPAPAPRPAGNDAGTPDQAAGFLGFGPKS